MVATLSLDTITSSGSNITVDATKTFTVNGSLLSSGSSNILRKTGDYTILEADVSGKSELIIATNAASGTRTITLPAVATTGLSTCIVTILCDTDATSTYKLMVQDSGTNEVWTGYQNGDFVRLIVSNSVWVVLDHKETYYTRRYLTANQGIAASYTTKLAATTNVTEIGNLWDAVGDKIVVPTGMTGWLDTTFSNATYSEYHSGGVSFWIDGSTYYNYMNAGQGSEGSRQNSQGATMKILVTSAQYLEYYIWNYQNNATKYTSGGDSTKAQFTCTFTRTY